MTLDFNTETSLTLAEKLLEQEHIINMKRIEVLSQIIIKLSNKIPKINEILNPELSVLIDLENQLHELEHTSENIL